MWIKNNQKNFCYFHTNVHMYCLPLYLHSISHTQLWYCVSSFLQLKICVWSGQCIRRDFCCLRRKCRNTINHDLDNHSVSISLLIKCQILNSIIQWSQEKEMVLLIRILRYKYCFQYTTLLLNHLIFPFHAVTVCVCTYIQYCSDSTLTGPTWLHCILGVTSSGK